MAYKLRQRCLVHRDAMSKKGKLHMVKIHHKAITFVALVLPVCFLWIQGCSAPMENVVKQNDIPEETSAEILNGPSTRTEGPKARIAVVEFTHKVSDNKHYESAFGASFQDMLATALHKTGRFSVLERGQLHTVLHEQDLGTAGRLNTETAAPSGSIEGAEFLVQGTITAFDPGTEKSALGVGQVLSALGYFVPGGSVLGQIVDKVSRARVAMELRLVDAKTGGVVAAKSVEETAIGVAGFGGPINAVSMGNMSEFAKTPMEKAIRNCVERAAGFIAVNTPKSLGTSKKEATDVVGLSNSSMLR